MSMKTNSNDRMLRSTHMQSLHLMNSREFFDKDNNLLFVSTQSQNTLNHYTLRSYGYEAFTNSSFMVIAVSM